MSVFTVAPAGAVEGVGVGVGDGEDELPTVKSMALLKTAPVESQAWITVLCCPGEIGRVVSRLALVLLNKLMPST